MDAICTSAEHTCTCGFHLTENPQKLLNCFHCFFLRWNVDEFWRSYCQVISPECRSSPCSASMLLVCLLSWFIIIILTCLAEGKRERGVGRGNTLKEERVFLVSEPLPPLLAFHRARPFSLVLAYFVRPTISNDELEFCFHKWKYGKNSSELTGARLLSIYAFWGGCPLTNMSRLCFKPLFC